MIKKTLRHVIKFGVVWALGVIVVLLLSSFNGPNNPKIPSQTPVIVNDNFFKDYGNRVYKITGTTNERSGGTGFAALARSGRTVTVTNHHICELGDSAGMLLIHTESGLKVQAKILYSSPIQDLCVVQGITGIVGLKVGNFARPTTYVIVLGHPYLEPLTLSAGVIENYQLVTTGELKHNECDQFGEEIKSFRVLGIFEVQVCLKTLLAGGLSARIYPGNSGSPVLNIEGEVVGVVYAGDQKTAEGFMMPLYALADLLERF